MPTTKAKLRKREIIFALAMGAAAAGISGIVIAESRDTDSRRVEAVETVALPDNAEYQVSAFNRIVTTGSQEVIVSIGDAPAVRAEGSPETIARLEAVVEDGSLVIRPREGFDFDDDDMGDVTFYITVPSLDGITLVGSGDVTIDRVAADSFNANVAGDGDLQIGEMTVRSAVFSIGGSGSIQAAGTADDTRVMIGGSGEVAGNALRSRTANLTVGGNGNISLAVDSRATISMLGAGDVAIAGPAECSVTRLGAGDVFCNGRPVED